MNLILNYPILAASIGGLMIGLSAGLYYIFLGRVFGISGFIFSFFERPVFIRALSISGLIIAGVLLANFGFLNSIEEVASLPTLIIAGFLVGYGSKLGNGCTSGHGICGISRFSLRSIISVIIFMTSAILTVFIKAKLDL